MTPDGLFGLLSSASCGAFALATDQTVVFWNRRAREILGYTPDRVIGRRCSSLPREVAGVTLTGECDEGCPMVRSLRAGLVPGRARLRMQCSWGEWKWLVVTPMVVSGVEDGGPLLVYLFGDSGEVATSVDVQGLAELGGVLSSGRGAFLENPTAEFVRKQIDDNPLLRPIPGPVGWGDPLGNTGDYPGAAETGSREVHLTEREREVLSYLALGRETKSIAQELGVSWYTARNHIENLRTKLGASNRLEAVMVAMRLGIIASE